MVLVRRFVFILIFTLFSIFSASAKDSLGFVFQFGAVGSEKTFSSTSTISGDTITMPYEKTTFDPGVYVGIDIPICDVTEQCFFGLDVGYNCSWNFAYESLGSSESKNSTFSHRFIIVPEFVFVKSNFRFIAGAGMGFDIVPYKNESLLGGVRYTTDYTEFRISLALKAGVKYRIGEKFFAVADATFFTNLFNTYNNNNYTLNTSGGFTLEVLPKVGLMFQF